MKLESTEPVEILEIFGKRAQVIKPGLERMREAWKVLGFPSKKIPTVLIAGTNGKGTTSGFLYRLLAVTGLRVGLFTSPHVREFRERIAVSDCEVTNQRVVASIHRMKQVLDAFWDKLTFFEINTLLALLTFEEEKVDWIVLEVGLGGRLDATNVVEPALSIITSIGMDHAEYLGPDTTAIAKEKAGIMRAGKPCIWGGLTVSDQAADAVVRSEAEDLIVP